MDLALFDFDNTLTVRDMMPDFVRAAVPRWRLHIGGVLIAPWLVGYRQGWVSGTTTRALVTRVGFAGMAQDTYARAGEAFANDVLPTVLRQDAMARLDWHRSRGDTVAVVSGSYDVYLAPWCRSQGVELIASRLEAVDGRLTGRYAGAQCVGEEKARRIRERFGRSRFDAVHAWGDSPEDAAMLALADHRWYRGEPVADASRTLDLASARRTGEPWE